MYELIQVGKNSFYMDCPSKVGFFRTDDGVVLIDSGSDKDSAKKVRKILDAQSWKLKAIYNTHSHADHIGGNAYLQELTGCRIYAPGLEASCAEYTELEPVSLYGGFPMQEMRGKFFMAKNSEVDVLTDDNLVKGLWRIGLPGHSYDMAGYRTSDNVVFLADSLASRETLEKYGLVFLYDVNAYVETLKYVQSLEAEVFVPSHASAMDKEGIRELAQLNIDRTLEASDRIKGLLSEPLTFDELLSGVFNEYGLVMSLSQRFLVGSTVKCYLSYLKNLNLINWEFRDNRMYWMAV